MHVRWSLAVVLTVASGSAALAETFGGFSAVDRPYLVGQDRVCAPLAVADGKASGMPSCEHQPAGAIAALDVKPPVEQRGPKASFVAAATGTTLTVSRNGAEEPVVTWEAPDPVVRVEAVYASRDEDRVAVAYTVRRLGREVTDVVAFEIVKTHGREAGTALPPPPGAGTAPASGTPAPAPDDPKVKAAVDAAKRASRARALAAWQRVLAIDPEHAEALYRVAIAQMANRDRAHAIATLGQLAKSTRPDAVEWLVEARFDRAFAPVRAERAYRDAVGLDRKPRTPYERLMGFGGQWEQTGTSCEQAQVDVVFTRDRKVKVHLTSACEGGGDDLVFHGTWRLDGDRVVLSLPPAGHKPTAGDEAPCSFEAAGDEDSLHCTLGHDLDITVLPARR